jgi:hypothetical protein
MANLDAMINSYAKKLHNANSLSDIRKSVEKDLYSKFGISKRTESMAYEIADCVAEKIKADRRRRR